ncbi:hypothetical protein JKP88DRAFT_290893 [Tribonema minus]|uniref:Uncharacterized protein n=1 Tax=Tribonema minus TaxID=303371 RepID=A0A835YT10_9STRA|nr:hypothetical protein JKP88DRAFT_290893 [Tribonema minus]
MSADKNATAAAALIEHMTRDSILDPADRKAVNAAIFRWASEQGRHGDAAQLRADNGGFVNGAATLESVVTKARRMLPKGSTYARNFYAPALSTMAECADQGHPDAEKVALALGALGGRRAKEVLYGSEHPMRKVGEHRVAAMLCVKGRKREAPEEQFDTIIPADLYLQAVAFVRSRIPCETVADVNRAEARMLNRMEKTPLLRKFKSAFLDHFKHRQRAGVNLMRTLYATEMTKGSERSLVDTARVLCHRPVRHAARHYDLIRAVEADTSEPATADLK